jgi:hypothetical protein
MTSPLETPRSPGKPFDLSTAVWLLMRLLGIYYALRAVLIAIDILEAALSAERLAALTAELSSRVPPEGHLIWVALGTLLLCYTGLAYYFLRRGVLLHDWIVRLVP